MLIFRIYLFVLLNCMFSIVRSQSYYMHEVYEDVVESGSEGFSGIVSLLVFFCIIWVISRVSSFYKEEKKRINQIKYDRDISVKEALVIIQEHSDISKYQLKESWQKGFFDATYDLSHNKVKEFMGQNVDDLVQDYITECEMGHMIKAEKIMEQIGYFQRIEYNIKQIGLKHKN